MTFESVIHSILLGKMEHYGISGLPLQLFCSYLTDRTQVVQYSDKGGNHLSSPQTILNGVPQGSVLGPPFYILYINDLLQNVPSSLPVEDSTIFSDDCSFHVSRPGNYSNG